MNLINYLFQKLFKPLRGGGGGLGGLGGLGLYIYIYKIYVYKK